MEILSINYEAKKIKNIILDILKYSDECYEVSENKNRLLHSVTNWSTKGTHQAYKHHAKQLNCSCVTLETQTKRL